MALISTNNGNTYTDVANLDEGEVSRALASGLLDEQLSAEINHKFTGSPRGETEDSAAWLDAYCAAHAERFGAALIIG